MRRALGFFLLAAAGCSGFSPPTADALRALHLADSPLPDRILRYRVRLDVESPWLAGVFEGVAVGWERRSPRVRAQFFGDLGPKMLDLLAAPERILGWFPQSGHAIDCALPGDATPDPVLFIGASLLEQFSPVTPERVSGIREVPEGRELLLAPAVPGMQVRATYSGQGRLLARRYRWMYGLRWEESWSSERHCRISAPDVSMQVEIVDRAVLPSAGALLELRLPPGARRGTPAPK